MSPQVLLSFSTNQDNHGRPDVGRPSAFAGRPFALCVLISVADVSVDSGRFGPYRTFFVESNRSQIRMPQMGERREAACTPLHNGAINVQRPLVAVGFVAPAPPLSFD